MTVISRMASFFDRVARKPQHTVPQDWPRFLPEEIQPLLQEPSSLKSLWETPRHHPMFALIERKKWETVKASAAHLNAAQLLMRTLIGAKENYKGYEKVWSPVVEMLSSLRLFLGWSEKTELAAFEVAHDIVVAMFGDRHPDLGLANLNFLKSSATLYKVGDAIWDHYPHLHDRSIQILYRGAGAHLGSLSMVAALIDRGAPEIHMTMTESSDWPIDRFDALLQEWSETNPDVKLKEAWSVASGQCWRRIETTMKYKGHRVLLSYVIWDESSHDTEKGTCEQKEMKQLLRHSNISLIHDSEGHGVRDSAVWAKEAALLNPSDQTIFVYQPLYPWRDDGPWQYIPGDFGCSDIGIWGHSFNELGPNHNGAIIFSNADVQLHTMTPKARWIYTAVSQR